MTASGCDDTCEENQNALPEAKFYIDVDGLAVAASLDSLQVKGRGAPNDSILTGMESQKSTLLLPFRNDSDITSYEFLQKAEGKYYYGSVVFEYSRTLRYAGHDCGPSMVYDIKSITWNGELIDSVTCPKGYIDNSPGTNINIYFADFSASNHNGQ